MHAHKRKRGGQAGNFNALKHGRRSVRKRAERRVKALAAFQAKQDRGREWMAAMPHLDHGAICAGIEASKARKH